MPTRAEGLRSGNTRPARTGEIGRTMRTGECGRCATFGGSPMSFQGGTSIRCVTEARRENTRQAEERKRPSALRTKHGAVAFSAAASCQSQDRARAATCPLPSGPFGVWRHILGRLPACGGDVHSQPSSSQPLAWRRQSHAKACTACAPCFAGGGRLQSAPDARPASSILDSQHASVRAGSRADDPLDRLTYWWGSMILGNFWRGERN